MSTKNDIEWSVKFKDGIYCEDANYGWRLNSHGSTNFSKDWFMEFKAMDDKAKLRMIYGEFNKPRQLIAICYTFKRLRICVKYNIMLQWQRRKLSVLLDEIRGLSNVV